MSADDLLEQVKAYFIERGFKPGDRIESEVELATRFGVSRHQMRKVLGAMVQAGVMERTPGRGTVIRSFDTDSLSNHMKLHFEVTQFDISEFREARIIVERAILPLAVRRVTAPHLAKIEKTIAMMRRFKDEPERADAYDRDFHLLIFQACGNDVLKSFSGVLATLFQSADYRRIYWTPEIIARLADEHAAILEAIRQSDVKQAVAALDTHLGYEQWVIVT